MAKAFTDINQSRKLAEILPPESADMRYAPSSDIHPWVWDGNLLEKGAILCWSLAALLNYLREIDFFPEIDADECSVTMNVNYYNEEEARLLAPIHNIKVKADSFINACVEMIIELHEQNIL